jgi:hypothetical protein
MVLPISHDVLVLTVAKAGVTAANSSWPVFEPAIFQGT